MSLIKALRKVAISVMKKQNNIFAVEVSEQKKYLSKFKEPEDDIERSYYQYKCQCFLKGKVITGAQNVAGLFLLAAYFIKYRIDASKDVVQEKYDAVFLHEDKPQNILPCELKKAYQNIKYNSDVVCSLGVGEIEFIKKYIKRHLFSPFFVFRCLNDLAEYAAIIKKYDPQAIICCSEYSFTSSILTLYCEERNVKHIDVMHGEKLFYIRDSFFRFHNCYVWDTHYCDLFNKMRAESGQFITNVPDSVKTTRMYNINKEFDYTYYLANETVVHLKKIKEGLLRLKERGDCLISIRPHPRYSNNELVHELFSGFNIEDPTQLSIEESIYRTRCAISLFSTVLMQAVNNDICIAIDDISRKEMFDKLEELDYIVMKKEHLLLSDILKDCG